jgi:hypothetical protein
MNRRTSHWLSGIAADLTSFPPMKEPHVRHTRHSVDTGEIPQRIHR